jgi:hypothetical protein
VSQARSYEQILRTSERVNWHLAEVVASLEFDFNRPFLPERIAATNSLSALSSEERLKLNQIRGHGYAHLFLFVEEFIVPLTAQLSIAHTHTDPIAMRVMLRFSEEELKHQELFLAVKAKLQKGFRSPLRGIEGRVEIADVVMQRSQLAVTLLTSMLEWITQRHYLECFRAAATRTDQRLDAGFSEVFRLHWVEEAQHAKLDTLELRRMAADATTEERERAVDEMLELCEAFDGLLGKQAELELDDLDVARGRRMGAEERSSTHAKLHAAYRWAFFVAGMDHPIFQQVVAELAPEAGPKKLERAVRRYAGSA